jgi:4,5-DOPA dioxygenase extradiol
MPALFVGHGNPMNALARNSYTEGWRALGSNLPLPRAIVCVSAHWYLPRLAVTAMARPRTIHDFGGFPRELFQVGYPAPGSPALAQRIAGLLAPLPVELDQGWGLDHGSWSVLVHLYPDASIPVVQLSIDDTCDAATHYEIARRLAPLRDEGVLILGSGNIVHNLHAYAWGDGATQPYDWALRFDARARELLLQGDVAPLVNYESLGRDAQLSAPTPDHYLPLLYVIAQRQPREPVSFPVQGFDGGSISMLCVRIG